MASIDIIEEVRKHIGSEAVPKIDPNTQAPDSQLTTAETGSGIIPAILVGFYKHSRNETTAAELLQNNSSNTLDLLFGSKKNDVITSVAGYAGISQSTAQQEMINTVAAVREVLRNEIKNPDGAAVSTFFSDQRSTILKHLPVELNMGELIEDSSVDDRTNKMEGPMSGMMHTIEKIFSSTK